MKSSEYKEKAKRENAKVEKIEKEALDELKTYADDIMKKPDFEIENGKSLVEKLIYFFAGLSAPFVGAVIYYEFRGKKNQAWKADLAIKGAAISIVIAIICAIVEIIL